MVRNHENWQSATATLILLLGAALGAAHAYLPKQSIEDRERANAEQIAWSLEYFRKAEDRSDKISMCLASREVQRAYLKVNDVDNFRAWQNKEREICVGTGLADT